MNERPSRAEGGSGVCHSGARPLLRRESVLQEDPPFGRAARPGEVPAQRCLLSANPPDPHRRGRARPREDCCSPEAFYARQKGSRVHGHRPRDPGAHHLHGPGQVWATDHGPFGAVPRHLERDGRGDDSTHSASVGVSCALSATRRGSTTRGRVGAIGRIASIGVHVPRVSTHASPFNVRKDLEPSHGVVGWRAP